MKPGLFSILCSLFCVLALAGCDETYPIVWSPDGSTLAFLSADGLRLGDAQGKLSGPILTGAKHIAWLPDSKRILVSDSLLIQTWTEAKNYLTDPQQKQAIDLSEYLKGQLSVKDLDALDHDPKIKNSPSWMTEAAVLYLRQTGLASLQNQLPPETLTMLKALTLEMYRVRLLDVKPPLLASAREVWRGLGAIESMRVSPDGKYALLVHAKETDSKHWDVELLSMDLLTSPVKLPDSVAQEIAWSGDSRQIIYIEASDCGEAQPILAAVVSLKLRGDDGVLLKPIGTKETLIYTAAHPASDIVSLKDGRVLFNAVDMQLPATVSDFTGLENVFCFKPGDRLVRALLSKKDAADTKGISSLKENQDDSRIAIVSSDAKLLELMNISTGQVERFAINPQSDPCWRTADEVCYTQPLSKKGKNQHDDEVVLHSLSKNKDIFISQDWPKSAVDGFLIHKKDK